MLLSEVAGKTGLLSAEEKAYVSSDEGRFQILRLGCPYASAKFYDLETLAARSCVVHEFKHCRADGSKFWTALPGIDYYFVFDKDQIEVLPKCGYSYPHIKIGNREWTLNVSGGSYGTGGWCDWIHNVASLCLVRKKSDIAALAANALSWRTAQAHGVTLNIEATPPRFLELAAAHGGAKRFKEGDQVVLKPGWSVGGSSGPFYYAQPGRTRSRTFYCRAGGSLFKAKPSAIDWKKTAETLGWELPDIGSLNFNRLGEISAE